MLAEIPYNINYNLSFWEEFFFKNRTLYSTLFFLNLALPLNLVHFNLEIWQCFHTRNINSLATLLVGRTWSWKKEFFRYHNINKLYLSTQRILKRLFSKLYRFNDFWKVNFKTNLPNLHILWSSLKNRVHHSKK